MTDWLTRKAEAEREWFRIEHERQFGKPPTTEQDVALNKVIAKLERLSRKKVCERKHFVPKVELPPPLVHIEWDAPLALHCACPTGDCSCTCKGNTLLPRKRLPIILPYDWWGVRPVLCKLHIVKRPKPAGDLAREFAEAVKKEAEFYKSKQGREILTERGPEFCLSGCLKFYITNKKIQKDFVKVISEMKTQVVTSEAPSEVLEEKVTEPSGKEQSDRICDQFRCTVSTQSQIGDDGEFIIGDYSHLLFGMPEEEFLCDIEGAELNVASYKGPVCAPRESMFLGVVKTADKLFHVTDIKQRISQVKKDLITSIFEIRERHHSKASQYECADLPVKVPEGVCESLADVRRKRREKECLEKNKVPVEEKVQTQDATCYCKFRYKVPPKSLDKVKKLMENNELLQGDTPVKPTVVAPPTARPLPSKSNLKPLEDKPCPPCVINIRSKTKDTKSLSDAGKRVTIDLSQAEKGSKDKIEVREQTSFIGSLKVSYKDNTQFENEKLHAGMPGDGKKLGVRFSKEVATDVVPEFYGNFNDNFDIISQKSNAIEIENIIESLKDQDNQTSAELLNKVMKDASILIEPEKNVVHKTISTVRSVELIILRPDAKCAKGNLVSDANNMRDPSCTPCAEDVATKQAVENENNVGSDSEKTQPNDALKSSNDGNLEENFEISRKSETGTENIGNVLKEMKKTYKDGTCQPCDKLLKIAKYINKALSEPSEDESKDLQAVEDVHDKTKVTGKTSPRKLMEEHLAPEPKVKDIEDEHPLADASMEAIDSKGNVIKKELYKTGKLKSSSTENKVSSLIEKPSSKGSQLQLPGVEKEVSGIDELRVDSNKGSKLVSHRQEKGSEHRLSELSKMKTESSKTRELKIESDKDSNIDIQIRRPSSEDKSSRLAEIEKRISKIDELKGVSSMESKIYSKTGKPSSKDRFSGSAQEIQGTNIDKLKDESIIKSEDDIHEAGGKEPGVKKELSKTNEFMRTSSMKSEIDSQVQELDSKSRLSAERRKQDLQGADELNVGSHVDNNTHVELTESTKVKKQLSKNKDLKKEVSKTEELKQTPSIESKIDYHHQKLGNKGSISKPAGIKDVSKTDELNDFCTGSKFDIQTRKPSSVEVLSKLSNEEKEVFKIGELKETPNMELKMNILGHKQSSKSEISKASGMKEEANKTDEIKDTSSTAFKIDSQIRRPSTKDSVPESIEVKKEVSKDVKYSTSSTESKTGSQTGKLDSKAKLQKVQTTQKISDPNEFKNISSTKSDLDFKTHEINSKDSLPQLKDVKKELSKTKELKEVSSIESKIHAQAAKSGIDERLSELTKVIKEASRSDELKQVSSPLCKINSKTRKPSCMGRYSAISELESVSKTDELKHGTAHRDTTTLKPKSKSWFSKLKEKIKEKTKSDQPKDSSSIMSHSDTQAQKASTKERLSNIKKEVSKTDELHVDSSMMCHSDSEIPKFSSKGRPSQLPGREKGKFSIDNIKKTSIESQIDTRTQKPDSKRRTSDLDDGIKIKSKTDYLKVTPSIESKLSTHSEITDSKERISKLIDSEKEKYRTGHLKNSSSIELKIDTQIQKPGSKSEISDFAARKKKRSEAGALEEISSTESNIDIQFKKSGSKGGISEFSERKKKTSKAGVLEEISSTEYKVDTQISKSGGKSEISEPVEREKNMAEADAFGGISSTETKVDTQIKKSDTKGGIKEIPDEKRKWSESDALEKISSTESKVVTQIKKSGSEVEISEFADREKKRSEADALEEISSAESKDNAQTKKSGSKGGISEFSERKKKTSEADELEEISSTESKVNAQTKKSGSKDGISEFIERKKKSSKADALEEISSTESKVDIQIEKTGSKGGISDYADRKKKKSEADALHEISSIGSKRVSKIKKSSSADVESKVADRKKEKSKTENLIGTSSTESEAETHIQKPSIKSRLSNLAKQFKTGKAKKVSTTTESEIDIQAKKSISKDATKYLSETKEESKTEKLKEVFSIISKEESKSRESGSGARVEDLKKVKKEISKAGKIGDIAESGFDTHSQKPIVKEGSLRKTDTAREESKSRELIETSSIECKFSSETQKLTIKGSSRELTKGKEQISKIDKLSKVPNIDSNIDTLSQKLSSKEGLTHLKEVKKVISETGELKELYSTESNKDAKIQKTSSKQILPRLREVKKELSKTEHLKASSSIESYIRTESQKSKSKAGPSKLTDVKKEPSKTDELKEVMSTASENGTKLEGDVPNLAGIKTEQTNTDKLMKISSKESKTGTQKISIKDVPQDEQKQHTPVTTEETGISKGKPSTAQPQEGDTKTAPKEIKQDMPHVAGPCPVKKLTNLKNTIKRYLVPEDIPKVCKDAACQPCHKLKGLEKIVHKAFSDIDHSDMRVNKGNTEKESEAKKKTDIVMSQRSVEGNSGRINVLNQTLSAKFDDVLPVALKLDETNKILETYITNSDHKEDLNRSEVKKIGPREDNENNSIQRNKISVPRDFYLSPLDKLMQLKDFMKSRVTATGPKTFVDSSPLSLEPKELKQDVHSVISSFRIENVREKIKALINSPHQKQKNVHEARIGKINDIKDNICNGKDGPSKAVPILKLGPPHRNIKSSEKARQSVSFKDNLDCDYEECIRCKSYDKYNCKSQKENLGKSESFNQNLGAYNVTSYEKLNSASNLKHGTRKTIRRVYEKMTNFDWKTLFTNPLGNENLNINQVIREQLNTTKPDSNNHEAKVKNENLKFSEEEICSRDLHSKKSHLKSSSTNEDCDMVVQEVIYDKNKYSSNLEDSVSSSQNLNKSYRFYY